MVLLTNKNNQQYLYFLHFRKISCNKRTQNTIDIFFLPKELKVKQNLEKSIVSTFRSEIGNFAEEMTDIRLPLSSEDDEANVFDISDFADCRKTDIDVVDITFKVWAPQTNYKFPPFGKKNLKYQYKWFQKWNWLFYSKHKDGFYCKYCVFFAETGGFGSQTLRKLIKTPFNV